MTKQKPDIQETLYKAINTALIKPKTIQFTQL